jgi:hypothetical protein
MKKLAAILCLTVLTTGAFAQGVVKFANSAATLVSAGPVGGAVAISANDGTLAHTWYFGLLSAPVGTTDQTLFTFAGVYGTNTAAASGGRLQGGSLLGVTMNNTWAPVTTRAFMVAGWSADNGAVWNPSWLTAGPAGGFFGLSSIATGQSGGVDPVTLQQVPALALFSGTTITGGFTLTPVPEPTTMALAGLGAAALLIFRRRK